MNSNLVETDVELLLTFAVNGKHVFMPDASPKDRMTYGVAMCKVLRSKLPLELPEE